MENFAPFFVIATAVLALVFAAVKFYQVKKLPEGNEMMAEISSKIRRGAMAYLKRQYKTVSVFFAVMVIILGVLAALGYLTPFVPFAFLTGGLFSALSGFVGMNIATYANSRTANGAVGGLNKGLNVEKGNSVSAQDVIGALGNTADIESSLETHLHLEILKNGKYVNPIDVINNR